MQRKCWTGPILVACALCCLPTNGTAQVLRGVVIDAESQAPLPAVLVALLDAGGQERLRYLVESDGVFLFPLPGPGVYSVRAERLGTETRTLDGIRVQADETVSVRIAMSVRAVTLEGIEVLGESRCELARDAGADVQLVWEEARKALTTQSLTDSEVRYRYSLQSYTRELDPNSLAIVNQTAEGLNTSGLRPIVSRPAEILLDSGFVTEDSQGMRYLAPDADVLLSEGFLDTHCFALRSGKDDEEGLIGLEFRPQSIRSGITDIEGVLWLEAETAHLQRLDFRYRNLPGVAGELDSDRVGGRVEFRALDNGAWIVSNWRIRMPIITEERLAHLGNRRLRLSSVIEQGGRVVRASRSGSGQIAYSEQLETITGQVELDSQAEPFGTVLVMGTGAAGHPDAQGRFTITDVPAGRYRLAYVRPDMMGLDRDIHESEVEVTPGVANTVAIRPRSREAVLAEICGLDTWTVGNAILIGDVVDPVSGVTVTAADVLVEWQLVGSLNLNALAATERSISTATNELGAFQACGIPTDRQLRVSARVGTSTYTMHPIVIPPDQPVMTVTINTEPDPPANDTTEVQAVSVDALEAISSGASGLIVREAGVRVMGRIEMRESGDPLPGALVRIEGLAPIASDRDGRFLVESIPSGRHAFEVEYLGREPIADTLLLENAQMVGVTIRLDEDPIPLEGIEVVVEQRSFGLERAGFYDRLDRSGISGTRITRWDIEQRPGAQVTHLLNKVPSARIMSLPSPGAAVMRVNRVGNRNFAFMPSGLPGCEPTVYLDGLRYRDSGAAEYDAGSPFAGLRVRNLNFLSAETIEGIEVYTGLAAPAQFNDDDCGVVLIWTRGYR